MVVEIYKEKVMMGTMVTLKCKEEAVMKMMVLVAMEIYKRKEEMEIRMVETYKCKEGKRRV